MEYGGESKVKELRPAVKAEDKGAAEDKLWRLRERRGEEREGKMRGLTNLFIVILDINFTV
jgi:hypothetical protein